jgi:putative phosphoesterase
MNKFGVISDIHGNYEALKCVLHELDKENITDIYCLGDVVGYYSQVNEVCNELRARNIPSLMGNHDWYMAGGGFCPRSKSVNDCLEYQRKVIAPDHLEWIKGFKVFREIGDIKMVHGGWADPIDEYLEPTEEYFQRVEGKVFFSGHTHFQSLNQFAEKVHCNPGSVGQPRDGDPRAAFAIYEDGNIALHRVPYDMEKVFFLMDKAGFNDYYYGGLKTGARNLTRLNKNEE